MKKNRIIIICLFFLLWPLSFGCSKADVIRGIIVSVDTTKNEIVIKDKKTGAEKTIALNPGDMTSLKKDAAVKVTLEPGTNKAQSIKLHSQRNKDE